MKAYLDRGRLKTVLDKIPLRLVTVDDLGLRGAHYVALTMLIDRNVDRNVATSTGPSPNRPARHRADSRARSHTSAALAERRSEVDAAAAAAGHQTSDASLDRVSSSIDRLAEALQKAAFGLGFAALAAAALARRAARN